MSVVAIVVGMTTASSALEAASSSATSHPVLHNWRLRHRLAAVRHELWVVVSEAVCELKLAGLQEVQVPFDQTVYLSVGIHHCFGIYTNKLPSTEFFNTAQLRQLFMCSAAILK